MKKIIIACSFLIAFAIVEGQNEIQALRYSQYNIFGTARYTGMGGAMGAIGGDFTAASTNPAGLAIYRKSEASFTPSFYWLNTSSNFNNRYTDDSKFNFNIGSMGLVSVYNTGNDNGFISGSLGLGYNSLANFTNRTTMRGVDGVNSLLDDFTWHANEYDDLSPYYEQLAYDTYLMPYDSSQGTYWHDMQLDGYGQDQIRVVEQSGYIGEYTISGAFNYGHFLYMGATFGIHSVRFYEDIYHEEIDRDNTVVDFNSFRFREFNRTRGVGYTGKFGIIIKPVHMLRIGASVHLPTYYRLTDEKFTDMHSTWDSGSGISDESANSPSGIYDYRLTTPFRFNGSAAIVLGKIAIISAGYEFVDYSESRLDAYDYRFFDENDKISSYYQETHNFQAGAELRFGTLYLRGGAQYRMSPYYDTRNNSEIWIYSGGLGVRSKSVSFDVSYSYSTTSEVYGMYAYQPGEYEISLNDLTGSNVMFTVGFKF